MYSGSRNRKESTQKPPFMPPLLLSATLLLTGCAPEEKTLLLTPETASEEETELAGSSRDFTVKKIYTYTYETRSQLDKSAFLQDCDENEIHIIALEDADGEEKLAYRQVDYRYGFYDTVGEFLQTWEDWNNPDGGEMESDLYIHRLLPSPDGKQLLVYVQSAFWDRTMVWLYALGEQELLLYEGDIPTAGDLQGSFSPTGRWVTFDAAGASTGDTCLVPVYDCLKEREEDAPAPWLMSSTSALFYPFDQILHTNQHSSAWPWKSALLDVDGQAGLISFAQEPDPSSVSATRILPLSPSVVPDASLLSEDAEQLPNQYQYQSCYLFEYEDMPYLHYSITEDGREIEYLGNPSHLCSIEMDTFTSPRESMNFPGIVWDFLRLDSGDVLVALAQETNQNAADYGTEKFFSALIPRGVCTANPYLCSAANPHLRSAENPYLCHTASAQKPATAQAKTSLFLAGGDDTQGNTENHSSQYLDVDNNLSVTIQELWGIQSADLYLYPGGTSEGQLLYKNLQNLLSMEYDAQNGRILLETYEGNDLSHRKCILLEL